MSKLKSIWKSISGKVILLSIPVYLFITISENWLKDEGQGWQQIHRSDVKGYYGYLLATFIRHDLGHEEIDGDYIHVTEDGTLNKYFIGTSIMMVPWFTVGHGLAWLTNEPQNGESWPYLILINLGALVYTFIALIFFRKLLLSLTCADIIVAWISAALVFASLILQYSTIQPGWTHIYSFCTIILFFYCSLQFQRFSKSKYLYLSAVLFALIILIRPVNGLILLGLPIVLGDRTQNYFFQVFQKTPQLLLSLALGMIIGSIQPLFWWLQTGNIIEWSYRSEGFHWNQPEIWNVLFSFRRGLFIYTPVLFLFWVSIPLLWKAEQKRAIGILIYFLVNTYLISCWWIWDYGGGFGQRPYIEHYPIMFLSIALAINNLKPLFQKLSYAFIGFCSVFTTLQWVQFQREIIQHEYMSWDKYKHVFLNFDQWYEFNLGGVQQIAPYHPNGLSLIYNGGLNFPELAKPWKSGLIVEEAFAKSARHVCELNPKNPFSTTLEFSSGEVPLHQALYLKCSVARYEPYLDATHGALVILAIEGSNGEKRYYDSHRLDRIRRDKPQVWEKQEMAFEIPPMQQGDVLSFYIWNQAEKTFFLDDMHAELYAVNPY